MDKIQNREVVLEVNNLKQHFVTGTGKYRIYNKAVDGVSFKVHRGEVFSLVGESGCGKTTIGRTIMRLYEPTDGEVHFLGKRIVAGLKTPRDEIKKLRKELRAKRKELKEELISQEEFDALSVSTKEKIDALKAEIKQRKIDQYEKYNPSAEEIRVSKKEARELNAVLKNEIHDLKAELALLKGNNKNGTLDEATQAKVDELKETIKAKEHEIHCNDTNSKSAGKSLLKKIQMIFQDPIDSLNPRMTVRDIVAEGLYINGINNREVVNEKVYEALKLVGLSAEHASHYPHEFSGGQRQRVGIARAIVCEPEVIIADEPISALDVSIQAQIINLLNDLKHELGLTIVFIAHDLSVVKHFSDTVAVMYFGHIVELGEKQKVFDHPLHPYTRSLIASIPQPNPEYERLREGIARYNPAVHKYTAESVVKLREIEPGHHVLCSEEEYQEYLKIVNAKPTKKK
ncbi:MAG: ATP-binding cassette domain-containing protein [Acholeplasmataceae bacterium]|jgi:oligopeptide transport system ATP-binding protein